MSLGSNIRKKRNSLKLSQEYVAEQLEISRQAVSKWETNQSEPSVNNLLRLADLFDCDIKEIIYGDEYWEEQGKSEDKVNPSKKNTKMHMMAIFGRILMLIGFSGYVGSDASNYGSLPDWYPQAGYGVFFLIGVTLTFVGSSDYFNRKSGSKKIIWFDLLFSFSFILFVILPFEKNINILSILLFDIAILTIIEKKFFIPIWGNPGYKNK